MLAVYSTKNCAICGRVLAYLRHAYHGAAIIIRDLDAIDNYADPDEQSTVRADCGYQDERSPVVYIDGEYQEFDDLLARVNAWEIAQRQDCDHCKADFIFG